MTMTTQLFLILRYVFHSILQVRQIGTNIFMELLKRSQNNNIYFKMYLNFNVDVAFALVLFFY